MTLEWVGMFCFVVAVVAYQLGHYRGWRARGIVEEEIKVKEAQLAAKKAELAALKARNENAQKLQARTKPWDCEHGC